MSNTQILVVEDESIVAKGIQNDLRSMGYDVPVIAASGAEAIEKVAETYPDLVLMDIVLKGDMDGIETSRKVRDQFDIPVVYLSAYEDDETLKRARLTEPFGYLLKPYEERELHTTIEMALYKHRIERRLKETDQWLSATLKCISDAVIATDVRQCVKFINPVAESLTGWARGDAFGKALADVFQFQNAPTFSVIENASHEAYKKGKASQLPPGTVVLSRDGRHTPLEGTVAAIVDEDGFFTGYVWVFRDISPRLQAEEERRKSEEPLRQAQKLEAVGRLAGGVAHDFNNLLTVILGNASLMLSNITRGDPNYDSLMAVQTASVRAAELVKQLMAFSGRSSLWPQPLNLNDSVQQMVGVLRNVLDSRINVEFTPAPDLWTIQADSGHIDEVIMNLCLNARDAMPEGGRLTLDTANVVVDADYALRQRQARPGDFVRLRVQDSGKGISPEVRSHLFEPFVTTKDPGKGVGLGLALVFGIVDQHRGWVEWQSEENQGTRFDVYLPGRRQQLPAVPPAAAHTPRKGTHTILLADDEPLLRELGRTILQAQGYHLLLAEDGVQAVEIYQRERDHIDLVILDLTMPRMSGADAFQHLLEIDPGVHVLFSSGYFAEDMTAQDDRILGFVTKPYRHDDLIHMVRAALEQVIRAR
jgi:PAS domain S-box-containing protein